MNTVKGESFVCFGTEWKYFYLSDPQGVITRVTRVANRHPDGTRYAYVDPAATYVEGVDYELDLPNKRWRRLAGGSIKDRALATEQFTPNPFAATPAINKDYIVWIDYEWQGTPYQAPKNTQLPRLFEKIKNGTFKKYTNVGDSTSNGGDVEKNEHYWQRAYVANIQKEWPNVTGVVENHKSIGGSNSDNLADPIWLEANITSEQDLIIVAHGMNEQASVRIQPFENNIRYLINWVRNTKGWVNTDFILVSGMLGNYGETWYTEEQRGYFYQIRDRMIEIAGDTPNVGFCDVTTRWANVLLTKNQHDMLFNSINHTTSYGSLYIYQEALNAFIPDNPNALTVLPPVVTNQDDTITITGQAFNLLENEVPQFQYSSDSQNWTDLAPATLKSGTAADGVWQSQQLFGQYGWYYFRVGVLRGGNWYWSTIAQQEITAPPTPPPMPVTDAAGFGLHPFGNFGFGQWDNLPVGTVFEPIDADPDLLVVFNEEMQPVAILDEAQNVAIEEETGGIETLEFMLPADCEKWAEIKGERRIRYQGREFEIITTNDQHDQDGQITSNVQSVIIAVPELNATVNRTLNIQDMTGAAGLMVILSGTKWNVGAVEGSASFTLKNERQTALANVRTWANMHGCFVKFDSRQRLVHLVKNPGVDRGVEVRLGKNMLSVERFTDYSNIITRLWPYGKDDLTVTEAHPKALEYIDNFSWYIAQGYTEEEIYADIGENGKASRFLKEGDWPATQYDNALALYDAATLYHMEAAQPRVSYTAKLVDISTLAGYEHEAYGLGDTLKIIDEKLGIETKQYIVKRKWWPREPWKDEAEMANRRITVLDQDAKVARTLEVLDQRLGAWNDATEKVLANFDAWQLAHNLNADGTVPMDLLRGIWYAANSAIRAGRNESVTIDENGLTIAEHILVEDRRQVGAFAQMGFGAQGFGDNTGDNVVIWKTDRYMRATGGAIIMCAGEGLPTRTAITPDGILAPAVMIDDQNKLTSGDGFTYMATNGVFVVDKNGVTRVQLGQYDKTQGNEKFGLKVVSKDGNTVVLDEDGIMQTWQVPAIDNIENGYPLVMKVHIPEETLNIQSLRLNFTLESFRAYSSTTESNTDTTSGASSKNTSDASSETTTGSSSSSSTGSENVTMGYKSIPSSGTDGEHNHGNPEYIGTGQHSHEFYDHVSHSHGIQHTHGMDHHHGMAHTHNVPGHSHDVAFGITTEQLADYITITIDGTDHTADLGGGTGFREDQENLDIKRFVEGSGWHTVEIGIAEGQVQRGRINASIFVQAKIAC